MSTSPPSLLILTTSQSPLAIKFPRPRKPTLNLPALVHRSLHSALDTDPPSIASSSSFASLVIPHPESVTKHDVPKHHSAPHQSASVDPVTINSTSQPESSLANGSSDDLEAEVTVKVHLVASASSKSRASWVKDALEALRELKGLKEIDTLLVGFKGVDYKGRRTAAADFFGCGAEGLTDDVAAVSADAAGNVKEVWDLLGRTKQGHQVGQVGSLYLPLEILQELSETDNPPKVNSLDTPDCHSLPKEYTAFAKEKGIQLWAGGGGEGSDPLPDADLHNLLHEFTDVLRSHIISNGSQPNGSDPASGHPLLTQIPLRSDGLKYEESARRGVAVRWILAYTLVSKSRNVLRDKGFIVAADFLQ